MTTNSTIKIRIAENKDYKNIIIFLKKYWNKNHIFIKNQKFFKYELCNSFPQFILAVKENKIIGLVGFYQYNKNYKSSDLFLVLLRVIEKYSNQQIAIKLILFIKNITSKNIHTIGATNETLPLYNLLNFKTGWLDHYFWINPSIISYKLCKIDKIKNKISKNNNFKFNKLKIKKVDKNINSKTYEVLREENDYRKSYWYFKKRYITYPIYKYQIYKLIDKNNKLKGLGVLRIVNINGNKCIRIIDWIGKLVFFKYFTNFCYDLAFKINGEFVDLYCSGIPINILKNTGLHKVTKKEIIPNHLSPLKYENIDISFVSDDSKKLIFFRGDCDQDRPN